MHLVADGRGRPLGMVLTGGNTADMVEFYVSGLSMDSAETGYRAGTVLFSSASDARLFLLAAGQ